MPSTTENLSLYLPDAGQFGVASQLNANLQTLDFRFDETLGHNHNGTAGEGPRLATTSITGLAEYIRDTIGVALVAGTNVTVTVNDVADTITIAAAVPTEDIDDRVAALLRPGSNITLTYDDVANTLTIASTGGGVAADPIFDAVGDLVAGSGANTAVRLPRGDNNMVLVVDTTQPTNLLWRNLASWHILDFAEAVDDRVNALLVAGTNITKTYDDAANTLTLAASGGGGGGGGELLIDGVSAFLFDDAGDVIYAG